MHLLGFSVATFWDALRSAGLSMGRTEAASTEAVMADETDRIAVMAALQIAQELYAARGADGTPVVDVRRKLRELNDLADEMLAPQEKLF